MESVFLYRIRDVSVFLLNRIVVVLSLAVFAFLVSCSTTPTPYESVAGASRVAAQAKEQQASRECLSCVQESVAKYGVNYRDAATGLTALMAVNEDHKDTIEFLLENGADPNYTTGYLVGGNASALHFSVRKGATYKVERLLEAGANPNLQAALGRTPLYYVLTEDSLSAEETEDVIEMLVDAGANPNMAVASGMSPPLHFVMSRENSERNHHIVSVLLRNGASLYAEDSLGRSAFVIAAEQGRARLGRPSNLAALLNAIPDYSQTNWDAVNSALVHAADRGKVHSIQLLLDYGADPNYKNKFGRTSLDAALTSPAILGETREIVLDVLRGAGARKSSSNSQGRPGDKRSSSAAGSNAQGARDSLDAMFGLP